MSRIVVLEVPDKARVSMRDILLKVKELNDGIELRVSMSFESWVELNQFDKLNEMNYVPVFPIGRKEGETKEEMIERIKKLAAYVIENKKTPIEKRDIVTKNCNTTEITCYNCDKKFQYDYEKRFILRKRAHGLIVRSKYSTVELESVGCPKCKDRSSLHFAGEIYDEWSIDQKRWVI